jgi:predicted nucleic acid-binding protein
MQPTICTIDSSCVIALDHLNLLPKLVILFSRVLVPKAVRYELFKRRATKDRLQSLFRTYEFMQPCNDYDKVAVEILLLERTRLGSEDRGEAEAVIQASKFGAAVLVDDPWGRKQAEKHNLDRHGTLWILERFCEMELISPSDLRSCLGSLLKRGTRLPLAEINDLLKRRREDPL